MECDGEGLAGASTRTFVPLYREVAWNRLTCKELAADSVVPGERSRRK
jgi:hypothetical protein